MTERGDFRERRRSHGNPPSLSLFIKTVTDKMTISEHLLTVAKGLWWIPIPFIVPKVVLTLVRAWRKIKDSQ